MIEPVREELLQALAAEYVELEPAAKPGRFTNRATYGNGDFGFLMVDRWLADRGIAFRIKDKEHKGRTVYVLSHCPLNSDHGDPDACITQDANGKLGFCCCHNGCTGKGWQDAKRIIGAPQAHHYQNRESNHTAHAREEQHQPGPEAVALCLADVERKPIEWTWSGRIVRGAINLIDGDPGLGKSFITLDIAARVSSGRSMPNEVPTAERKPGNVLLLNAEDDLSRTIRPRLDTLGADLSRIFALTEVVDGTSKRLPVLPGDLALLLDLVRRHAIDLLVLDPFMAFLDEEKVDSHKDSSIRRVMFGLRQLAELTNVAILLIRHLNKLVNVADPIYRGGGSIGIIGAARSALLVAKHPDDDEQRVLSRVKGNLSAPPDSLVYTIQAEGDSARVDWLGLVELTANDLLANSRSKEKEERDKSEVRKATTKLLVALDELDPGRNGATKNKVRQLARISHRDLTCAVQALIVEEIIEEVTVQVTSGKGRVQDCEGIRRRPIGQYKGAER